MPSRTGIARCCGTPGFESRRAYGVDPVKGAQLRWGLWGWQASSWLGH